MNTRTISDKWRYIREVVKGVQRIENRLEDHVIVMCELLYQLIEVYADSLDASTKRQFADIYWSLKLHLLFHLGADTARNLYELKMLGRLLKLTDEELNKLPNEERAIDPGSKLLEIVSINLISRMKKDSFEPRLILIIQLLSYTYTIPCLGCYCVF